MYVSCIGFISIVVLLVARKRNLIPLEKILKKNSSYNRGHLKNRLIKQGLLKNECYVCFIKIWNNKKIVFELDHIDGVYNNNELSNLRLICPNCHSQTINFCNRKH